MSYENISVNVTAQDVADVKQAIATINAKLSWLVTLTTEEVKGLTKLGPKSLDFVQDAKMAFDSFPSIIPPSFNVNEFRKDTTAFQALTEIKVVLDSLHEKVQNTYYAVGSEAMVQALEVYAYVQTGKDRTPGLNTLADKMKERFKKTRRSQPEKSPTQ